MSSGLHWSYQGGAFTIFGQEGWINREGKWMLPTSPMGGGWSPVAPTPIATYILGIIQDDIRKGNGDKIAYVGVDPYGALLLALEGVITEEWLNYAEETTDDRITLIVILGGVERLLVILRHAVFMMATCDVCDEVV